MWNPEVRPLVWKAGSLYSPHPNVHRTWDPERNPLRRPLECTLRSAGADISHLELSLQVRDVSHLELIDMLHHLLQGRDLSNLELIDMFHQSLLVRDISHLELMYVTYHTWN
ncbi:hypothetical protein NDU88_001272 [Pleurodeles waltl]|uniref:Uncharacterized protein n=1 Tax=Pleurodeles waltl TaxID=8319 RepID=A0AAV7MJ89_PLEWA|nr:hypothetical protein NDU88_001272 [Pleurodeles waltl]